MSIKKSILICVGEHFSNLNLVPVFLCNRTVWFRAVGADSYSWSADESGLDWQPSQHIGPRSLFTQSSSFVLQLGTQHVDVRRSIHASALSIVRWRVVVRCRFWLWLWNSPAHKDYVVTSSHAHARSSSSHFTPPLLNLWPRISVAELQSSDEWQQWLFWCECDWRCGLPRRGSMQLGA